MLYLSILMFFILQVGAGLLFKMGAVYKECWLLGFVLGNILGITSICFLMHVYKHLNPNVSEAICRGGYFVLIQIAFILVFNSRLSFVQWCGMFFIIFGIFIVSLCDASVKM